MLDLAHSGLFGGGLVNVKIPSLISRYNKCLLKMGITPTELTEFNIDGMGWSPEIAEEKDDPFYLCHGDANQLAIILTPDQAGKPVHFPCTSFDRRMMEAYFEQFKAEIADITSSTCIWLDIDQEITTYNDPSDLLLVQYVVIRSSADDLIKAAEHQKKLIDRFASEDDAWMNGELHKAIAKSAERFGDLRYRRIDIPDMQFSDFKYYYTRAFGGVFVFRNLGPDDHPLLVMENQDQAKNVKGVAAKHVAMLHGSRNKLMQTLIREGLLEIDLMWYKENLDELRHKRGAIVMDALCRAHPDIDYQSLSTAHRKKLIQDLGDDMPAVFFDLERLIKTLERDEPLPNISKMSLKLRSMLVHPHSNLSDTERKVVWRIVCRIFPLDVLRLYISDRDFFYRQYKNWPKSKKTWAIGFIQQEYVSTNNGK